MRKKCLRKHSVWTVCLTPLKLCLSKIKRFKVPCQTPTRGNPLRQSGSWSRMSSTRSKRRSRSSKVKTNLQIWIKLWRIRWLMSPISTWKHYRTRVTARQSTARWPLCSSRVRIQKWYATFLRLLRCGRCITVIKQPLIELKVQTILSETATKTAMPIRKRSRMLQSIKRMGEQRKRDLSLWCLSLWKSKKYCAATATKPYPWTWWTVTRPSAPSTRPSMLSTTTATRRACRRTTMTCRSIVTRK